MNLLASSKPCLDLSGLSYWTSAEILGNMKFVGFFKIPLSFCIVSDGSLLLCDLSLYFLRLARGERATLASSSFYKKLASISEAFEVLVLKFKFKGDSSPR